MNTQSISDGADVVLIPDNDTAGPKGMTEIATKLHGTASRIRMLELPGLGPRQEKHGKDFSDWIELEGNTADYVERFGHGDRRMDATS